jgi:D-glycero-D-manno-heptose 1,7-bisphosphate phosphatase
VFLDRDGVLVEDVGLPVRRADLRILPGVPEALARLKSAGFALVVVSNQTVVARGLLDEAGARDLQADLERRLVAAGAPPLDGFYFCPHHPSATDPAYRTDCGCRKPRPGLVLAAAQALRLDPGRSFLVGDRPSDLAAGERAGCRVVWVQTGRHLEPPIESPDFPPEPPRADHICAGLAEAAAWIEAQP